jgi:hypothetical protein
MARRPRGYIFRCNTKILRLCLYMLCDITVGDVSSRRSVFPITPAPLRHLLISGGNSHAGFPLESLSIASLNTFIRHDLGVVFSTVQILPPSSNKCQIRIS